MNVSLYRLHRCDGEKVMVDPLLTCYASTFSSSVGCWQAKSRMWCVGGKTRRTVPLIITRWSSRGIGSTVPEWRRRPGQTLDFAVRLRQLVGSGNPDGCGDSISAYYLR